ncbi:MAG: TolC family protein [Prevotellaceae bacterium]|jgi:cobalt-zinc-cadmium resistance protein CzcA|nr:TolC family protein [Prevotellaceae bacterium]
MFNKIFINIIIFSLISVNQSINAQNPRVVTLDEAVKTALKNSNAVKAENLNLQSAKMLKQTRFELPKLEISSQFGQYSSAEFDNAFSVSQTIPFPTLWAAKKNLVNAEFQKADLSRRMVENELKSQVRAYFCQMEYFLHNQLKLKQLDSIYSEFIRVANLRYSTGESNKIEISTAETQQGEIALLLRQNKVFLQNAQKNLQILLNTPDSIVIPISEKYEPLPLNFLIDSANIAQNYALQLLQQDIKIAEQNKKLELAQALPDITLGYTNQSLIGFQTIEGAEKYFGADKRFHYFNVSIAIPLTIGVSSAKAKAAKYRRQSAEFAAEQQMQTLSAQLQNAVNQHNKDVLQYQYYVEKALPAASEIINAAQKGYQTGEISYIEYLFALQTAKDIELKYLQSVHQINQTVIFIYSLINI